MRAQILNRIVVIALAVFALALTAPDIVLPWKPFSTFGFNATPAGKITGILPDSAADRAGLRAGDRVDIGKITPHEQRYLCVISPARAGLTITLPVISNGIERSVTLVAHPRTRSAADNVSDVVLIVEQCLFVIIAATLAYLRPSWLTWTFYLYAVGVASNSILVFSQVGDAMMPFYTAVASALPICGGMSMIACATFFPRTAPGATARRALPLLALIGIAWFIFNAVFGYDTQFHTALRGSESGLRLALNVNLTLPAVMYVVAVVAFFVNYMHSSESDRKRLQWVALGFACGFGGIAWLDIAEVVMQFSNGDIPLWAINLLQAMNICIPISVAYAIMKHRVIDVRFFVSRALVYGLITTLAVAILALLDWAVAKRLEATQLGVAVEIAGALAIGLGVHRMHAFIDNIVDRYVFRSVHEAEQHLHRIGEAMMFARSTSAIDDMLASETTRALRLESATVVREFDPDDSLALQLHAGRMTLEHGDSLAMPLLVRHQLIGYVLYGHHENGAAIDPTEREILERISARAAVAYDHVLSEERAAENERLAIENRVLRSLVGQP
ncbi:MAG: hypothetical protein JO322_05820 [Candidatus Eremiobacteraeota bacterium]|nr:hypothetical protein [Candidatus Eremiobacteraeota bacterium]